MRLNITLDFMFGIVKIISMWPSKDRHFNDKREMKNILHICFCMFLFKWFIVNR